MKLKAVCRLSLCWCLSLQVQVGIARVVDFFCALTSVVARDLFSCVLPLYLSHALGLLDAVKPDPAILATPNHWAKQISSLLDSKRVSVSLGNFISSVIVPLRVPLTTVSSLITPSTSLRPNEELCSTLMLSSLLFVTSFDRSSVLPPPETGFRPQSPSSDTPELTFFFAA